MDEMMPVWINLLFILVAQTVLWVFVLSRLFQHSTNRTIQRLNGCIRLGHSLSPARTPESDISDVIQEIPPPTVACNWTPIRKLLLVIVAAFLFVAWMITRATKPTKGRIWTLFLFSLLAYSLEILFLQLVVLPYNHIDTEEIIYHVTDLEK